MMFIRVFLLVLAATPAYSFTFSNNNVQTRSRFLSSLSMKLQTGIVGLPNVGKSTLFNALVGSETAQAANFPFCTIGKAPLLRIQLETLLIKNTMLNDQSSEIGLLFFIVISFSLASQYDTTTLRNIV